MLIERDVTSVVLLTAVSHRLSMVFNGDGDNFHTSWEAHHEAKTFDVTTENYFIVESALYR